MSEQFARLVDKPDTRGYDVSGFAELQEKRSESGSQHGDHSDVDEAQKNKLQKIKERQKSFQSGNSTPVRKMPDGPSPKVKRSLTTPQKSTPLITNNNNSNNSNVNVFENIFSTSSLPHKQSESPFRTQSLNNVNTEKSDDFFGFFDSTHSTPANNKPNDSTNPFLNIEQSFPTIEQKFSDLQITSETKSETSSSEDSQEKDEGEEEENDNKKQDQKPFALSKPRSRNAVLPKTNNKERRHTAPVKTINEVSNQLRKEGLVNSPSPHQDLTFAQHNKDATSTTATASHDVKKGKYNVLPELLRGTALLKYGRRGYPHFRQFQLSAEHTSLQWFSKNKKLAESAIFIKDIDEVQTGQPSKEFKRIGWSTLEPASFCIFYDRHQKSLSLVAKSVDEMKMWVQALKHLRDKIRKGEDVSNLEKLEVDIDFRDRNRPRTKPHSGRFLRSDDVTIKKNVDPMLQQRLKEEMATVEKRFSEIAAMCRDKTVERSEEYNSIQRILSDLEERICELKEEVEKTRDTKIAENDVWRTKVDMEALREKIQVLIRESRAKQRRWSVNF